MCQTKHVHKSSRYIALLKRRAYKNKVFKWRKRSLELNSATFELVIKQNGALTTRSSTSPFSYRLHVWRNKWNGWHKRSWRPRGTRREYTRRHAHIRRRTDTDGLVEATSGRRRHRNRRGGREERDRADPHPDAHRIDDPLEYAAARRASRVACVRLRVPRLCGRSALFFLMLQRLFTVAFTGGAL